MGLIVSNSSIGGISISSGIDTARPAASSSIVGSMYLATDTGITYQCVSPTAWQVANQGPDKVSMGVFSDANYLSAGTGAGLGPTGSPPFSWAMGLYVVSQPGLSTGKTIWAYTISTYTKGWTIYASNVNANTLAMSFGIGGALVKVELSANTLTTGAHAFAMCWKTGAASVRYCMDGGSVSAASVTAGAYTAPDSACAHYIGRAVQANYPFDWGQASWLQAFNADLADADLQTLSGSPSTYRPPAISTNPVFDWRAAAAADGSGAFRPTGAQSARMVATALGQPPLVFR